MNNNKCRVEQDLNDYEREQELLEQNPIRTCIVCDEQLTVDEMHFEEICECCVDSGHIIGGCIFIDENENCYHV